MFFVVSSTACLHGIDSGEANTERSIPADARMKSENEFEEAWRKLTGSQECQTTEDCQLIGWGYRPCGGPDKYRVYSAIGSDERKVNALVESYNLWNKNNKKGMVGICIVAQKPTVLCVAKRCQITE